MRFSDKLEKIFFPCTTRLKAASEAHDRAVCGLLEICQALRETSPPTPNDNRKEE